MDAHVSLRERRDLRLRGRECLPQHAPEFIRRLGRRARVASPSRQADHLRIGPAHGQRSEQITTQAKLAHRPQGLAHRVPSAPEQAAQPVQRVAVQILPDLGVPQCRALAAAQREDDHRYDDQDDGN
jgi:hypothetical protein